jgi:hypothetical protein
MEGVMAKLSATELQMLMRAFSVTASESTPRPVQRISEIFHCLTGSLMDQLRT